MKGLEIRDRAIAWFGRSVAQIEDATTPYGLRRRTYVSLNGEWPAPADFKAILPKDAEEITTLSYLDEDDHPTLLITFKTPASRARATRPDPMKADYWLEFIHKAQPPATDQKETS